MSFFLKKVIYKFDFYSFSNLKKWFPNLNELDEFIVKDEYLGGVKIAVSGLASQLEKLGSDDEFDILVKVVEQITSSLVSSNPDFRGSKEFKYILLKEIISDKELDFAPNEGWDKELGRSMNDVQETKIPLDLSNRPWHVFNDCFGTSEEKHFVKYIDKVYNKLEKKYDEIYLIRNERFFKIYNLEDGRPLEPDYVLFLKQKKSSQILYYQVFIEPKGSYLEEKDDWKQKFLVSLEKEHKVEKLWEDKEYVILGMPFYSKGKEEIFDTEFKKLL